MSKNQKHHVYPHKHRHKGTTEIKYVKGWEHRLWHMLVSDMHPADAIRYLADKFLPSEYRVEVVKR